MKRYAVALIASMVISGCATTGSSVSQMPSPETITAYAVAGVKVAGAVVEVAKLANTLQNLNKGEPKN